MTVIPITRFSQRKPFPPHCPTEAVTYPCRELTRRISRLVFIPRRYVNESATQSTLSQLGPQRGAPPGFSKIPRAVLKAMRDPPFSTYVLQDGSAAPVLFGDRDYLHGVSAHDLDSHWENATFYVQSADHATYQKEIERQLDSILVREDLSIADRFSILQSAVAQHIEHSFRLINCNTAVRVVQEVGDKIATLLRGAGTLPREMYAMVQHDCYTFTHLTNVASYAVVLAENLGVHDSEELKQIAAGGLLHDLGKRLIPKSILNKNGPLNDQECDIIRSHPQKGYEELCERSDLSFGQLMMVYQHHERVNGQGYPVRVPYDEIHPWARICAVVDVFDAMSCRRSYRRALPAEDVSLYMNQIAGSQLDEEMVRCWTSAIATP